MREVAYRNDQTVCGLMKYIFISLFAPKNLNTCMCLIFGAEKVTRLWPQDFYVDAMYKVDKYVYRLIDLYRRAKYVALRLF